MRFNIFNLESNFSINFRFLEKWFCKHKEWELYHFDFAGCYKYCKKCGKHL